MKILRAFSDANQAFHSNFNWMFSNFSIIGNNFLYPCSELYTLCVVCASPLVALLLCTCSSSLSLGLFPRDLLT